MTIIQHFSFSTIKFQLL